MRLMHVALIVDNSPQTALRDALRGIATSGYIEYDWCRARAEGFDTSSEIRRLACVEQPDVIFAQCQDPTVWLPQDAAQCPGFRVQWSGDVRQPLPQWYVELGRVIDLSLFSNEADPLVMAQQGANAAYLDIGFNENLYRPDGPRGGHWPPVLFLGGNYGDSFPLSQLRRDMVARLSAEFPSEFGVYGHGWSGPNAGALLNEQTEAEALRSCKIAINLSHYDLERYSSDRLLRSLGCGAFVLSHNYAGIEKDWKAGEHLVIWNDLEDLVSKVRWALGSQLLAGEIAEDGCKEAHARHTWGQRIRDEFFHLIPTEISTKIVARVV